VLAQSRFAVQPERPTSAQLKQVRNKLSVEIVEGLDEASSVSNSRIKVLTLVPQNSINLKDDPWVLQISQDLPATLVANALDVQSANRGVPRARFGPETVCAKCTLARSL
jgi:hypothetical protein